jgi:hypothetical protein
LSVLRSVYPGASGVADHRGGGGDHVSHERRRFLARDPISAFFRATFLNLSSLVHILVSILERVVPSITEAVVEATAAGGGEDSWPAS